VSRRRVLFGFAAVLTLCGGAAALDAAFTPDLTKLHQAALLVLAADGRPIAALGSPDHFWRLPTTAQDVDQHFVQTLIATEDRRFWAMPGIDPVAILRAGMDDAKAGRVVSGASTITMQVARLLTPYPRTPLGKLEEMLRALQLAAHYSKAQILAMYLTLAPYGGNIEGVQAASWLYFGHGAAHLSEPEIALLIALPRRPEALRPDRHAEAAVRAVDHIYAEQKLGAPPEALAGAIKRHAFADDAPYLARHLWATGNRGAVDTTIDASLQDEVAHVASAAADDFGAPADVAILVIHNQDAKIIAYAGGAGLARMGGYVDMIQAVRSPGSTLKPFIYGMAFDRDLATPATLIDDTPLANATYDPADFDRSWHGIVPVAVALQQSYNLPAVKMLEAVGPAAAVSTLRMAGMEMALPEGDNRPSLAIALGGVGVRLADLCALYAGLTAADAPQRLRLLTTDTPQATPPVMTPKAAAQILAILEGLPPPDGTSGFGGRAVAYKTGTSYGFRDAWSIGVSADWTVGVWVGRPDGTPRPGAYGLDTAAPVMARVFSLLPTDQGALPAPIVVLPPPADAAPGMIHFGTGQTAAQKPQIVFPPPGAAVEVDGGTPVALEATGGAPPYRWIVDGTELDPPPIGEDPSWLPPSPGFFRITAIDQSGAMDSEIIQVR
jgi:penicillin-binding protein 1C